MADVKWIKITTDIFDDDKILLIESLPEKDSLIVIWFKLLCMAGKQNNSGVFTLNDRIAYTDEMLATIFRRPINTVRLALQTFQDFGMIDIIDGVITIPNWGKHQNLDQLESRKQYMQGYMKEYRAKQKALTGGSSNSKVNSKTNSKTNVNKAEKNKRRIEKERELEEEGEEINKEKVQQIAELFNTLCPSLSKVIVLSDSIKTDIANSLQQFSEDQIKAVFEKAEASSFLKGNNDRKWAATFDWLIKGENIAKVLNGNYDEKETSSFSMQGFKARCEQMPVYKQTKTAAEDETVRARAEALKQQLSTG